MSDVTIAQVREALARIRTRIRATPVMRSDRLDEIAGARVFFKCENLQETGSFKARGALNTVLSLSDDQAARGVATHSSGNHGTALAWAAGMRKIPATAVMPSNASPRKVASVKSHGGTVIFSEPNHKAREETAAKFIADTGAHMVHPYNDGRIVAGQGTVALEFMEEMPDLDVIVCPVGGGGLLAGTAIVAKSLNPKIKVYAGEPEGAADTSESFRTKIRTPFPNPKSVADGLLAFVGDITFPEIVKHVDGVATVSEEEIERAMRLLFDCLEVPVEPSGAVGFAAVAGGKLNVRGKKIGVIISGGNIDLERNPWAKASSK
ncbi:MAG TPA: pyridoxal-phosphate dependent enzyme [Opitutaceae bacterium]|nr:pyridoxal-phosphate dependent enzyme [Opitutaceae bacterium]